MLRRELLKYVGAGLVIWRTPSALAVSENMEPARKLVWVVLRGAMDSIHTVVPTFDKDLKKKRAELEEILPQIQLIFE